jgi:hypothetical protein
MEFGTCDKVYPKRLNIRYLVPKRWNWLPTACVKKGGVAWLDDDMRI